MNLDMFLENKKWRGFDLGWCDLCDCAMIQCPECKSISCSGGGCDKCSNNPDMQEFDKLKMNLYNYLSKEEMKTYNKIRSLRDFISHSLVANKSEIDYNWIHSQGYACENDYKYFSELHNIRADEAQMKLFSD